VNQTFLAHTENVDSTSPARKGLNGPVPPEA
jgi:hypothetical protein